MAGCKNDLLFYDLLPGMSDECDDIWGKIEDDLKGGSLQDLFYNAHRIRILGEDDSTDPMECYNSLYLLDGWCEIVQEPDATPSKALKWGFCSPSCKFIKVRQIHQKKRHDLLFCIFKL